MAGPWSLRDATAEDSAAIARAELACFSDPWSAGSVQEMLHNGTTFGLLADDPRVPDRLAGYLLARTIAGQGEILTLGVDPGARRRGLGRQLLDLALERMVAAGAAEVFLEVRESNRLARSLYLGRGFRPTGVRPDYYRNPREHALVLRWAPDGLA